MEVNATVLGIGLLAAGVGIGHYVTLGYVARLTAKRLLAASQHLNELQAATANTCWVLMKGQMSKEEFCMKMRDTAKEKFGIDLILIPKE